MKIKKGISILSFAVVAVCALFVSVPAQGRYANVYSRTQVDEYVRQLEQSSNVFREAFRQEINRNSVSASSRRTYNRYATQFENALDRLRRRFSTNDSWWESRNEVQAVISNSQDLNNLMNTAAFRRPLERQWNNLRDGINRLADTYDLPGLNGGGWRGGGGGFPGGRRGDVPTWAVGTFYGRNPENGGTIALDINRNGRVQISFDGIPQPTPASMDGTTLINGPYISNVTRLSNGIRTTDRSNGNFIDYYRTPIRNGGVGIGDGRQRDIPSWAIGTFYGRNPENGGTIRLTVQRNGRVTITFDGRTTEYGTMNGTTFIHGQFVDNITRLNNGIRTTNSATGQSIDYFRR